jgi:hypothetical protein
MMQRNRHSLVLACGVVTAMLAMSCESQGGCRLWDCMFGAAPAAQTTYAPAYVPSAPAYTAPACQPACQPTCVPVAAPSCSPCCETYVPCATPCTPQPCCNYATYRPYYSSYYAPTVVTAYRPVVGVYPLTTYRPFLGTYQTRLVPYTTSYQAYYAAPAVTYGYSPCSSCAPCGGCSSCASCGSGGCGVTYQTPASGCSSCNASVAVASEPAAESKASAPPTFKTNKPPVNEEPAAKDKIDPIPDPKATPSSTTPALPDPNDRTASRTTDGSARVLLITRQAPAAPVVEDSGWHPAKRVVEDSGWHPAKP